MKRFQFPPIFHWVAVIGFFCVGCSGEWHWGSDKRVWAFDENSKMQNLSSDLRIQVEDLQKWDEIVSNLLEASPLKRDGDSYRLYTYLYYAQKAFADNSFAITNAYSGSLDSISLRVIQFFYPNYNNNDLKEDPFSEELAAAVISPIKKRYEAEEKQIRPISVEEKKEYWKGKDPVGMEYPTMKPWALKRVDEFKSKPPPSPNDPYWEDQLAQTEEKMASASEKQKQMSLFWERMVDPQEADWRFIAVKYLNEKSIPLEMQLETRSKVMMALMDALIAVFNDKYTYMVKRPFMRDPHLKPLFRTPNHPSYPAAHGTVAAAADIVLCYYFPENQKSWNELAHEARVSRLWGGIHFPIDLESGRQQGELIGKAVLFR